MMKICSALLIIPFLCISFFSCAQKQVFNIDAEELAAGSKIPKGWIFAFNEDQKKAYVAELDPIVKHSGKHSISILNVNNKTAFYAIEYPILKTYEGREILLKGYIKTENVKSGFAGLWMRIDGEQPTKLLLTTWPTGVLKAIPTGSNIPSDFLTTRTQQSLFTLEDYWLAMEKPGSTRSNCL